LEKEFPEPKPEKKNIFELKMTNIEKENLKNIYIYRYKRKRKKKSREREKEK